MDNNFDDAVKHLKNNQWVKVNNLRFEANDDQLRIVGWSQYRNIHNITKSVALNELEEIKRAFFSILSASNELNLFVATKSLEYILAYNDAGKTSVDVCSEKDGIFQWLL